MIITLTYITCSTSLVPSSIETLTRDRAIGAYSKMERDRSFLKRAMARACISVTACSLNVDVHTLVESSIKEER